MTRTVRRRQLGAAAAAASSAALAAGASAVDGAPRAVDLVVAVLLLGAALVTLARSGRP